MQDLLDTVTHPILFPFPQLFAPESQDLTYPTCKFDVEWRPEYPALSSLLSIHPAYVMHLILPPAPNTNLVCDVLGQAIQHAYLSLYFKVCAMSAWSMLECRMQLQSCTSRIDDAAVRPIIFQGFELIKTEKMEGLLNTDQDHGFVFSPLFLAFVLPARSSQDCFRSQVW